MILKKRLLCAFDAEDAELLEQLRVRLKRTYREVVREAIRCLAAGLFDANSPDCKPDGASRQPGGTTRKSKQTTRRT